jgi:hypothetical protein
MERRRGGGKEGVVGERERERRGVRTVCAKGRMRKIVGGDVGHSQTCHLPSISSLYNVFYSLYQFAILTSSLITTTRTLP